ncbi:MAG: hypothetical protein EAZ95_12530 [Bacteroidetes bacterium]|nr:MAG: hypothetical protein EAZ95_12530 [Bacteroidota bacterium]
MHDYSEYIIAELRDGGIDIEYDGFLKNLHPTLTFFVVCHVETSYVGGRGKQIVVEMPPLSEKMVMSHSCGPTLENEFSFEITGIYTEKP